MMTHEKIFFIHVPKTAGTSFGSYLRTEFPQSDRDLSHENRDNFKNIGP